MLSKLTVLLLGYAPLLQILFAQSSSNWNLPQGQTVQDVGARTYTFTIDYNTANDKGEVTRRQRFTGEYTRGLGAGEVLWKNVTEADADGATTPFSAPQKRDFMQGFRYRDDLARTLQPGFFKGFPPNAVFERNLVWDTAMMEDFGQNFFDRLKLNQPYHFLSNQDVNMPDVGTFRNRDVMLEWVGRSQRNGQDCALINYQAFFNPVKISNPGMTLEGRSDYWGQLWVALATKQIEYGTIYENVQGEINLAGQPTPQHISVLRAGVFEPLRR